MSYLLWFHILFYQICAQFLILGIIAFKDLSQNWGDSAHKPKGQSGKILWLILVNPSWLQLKTSFLYFPKDGSQMFIKCALKTIDNHSFYMGKAIPYRWPILWHKKNHVNQVCFGFCIFFGKASWQQELLNVDYCN